MYFYCFLPPPSPAAVVCLGTTRTKEAGELGGTSSGWGAGKNTRRGSRPLVPLPLQQGLTRRQLELPKPFPKNCLLVCLVVSTFQQHQAYMASLRRYTEVPLMMTKLIAVLMPGTSNTIVTVSLRHVDTSGGVSLPVKRHSSNRSSGNLIRVNRDCTIV